MKNTKLILTVEEAAKDHNKWLETRNKGIGGSDAGVIMGLNPYKSRLSLWMEKTGQKGPDDLSENNAVYWGIKNEPNIADWFCEVTGKKVRRCGTLQSMEHPWLIANVDRVVDGENAGLEIKTAGVRQAGRWKDDELPDEYYCQCQHYMMVTGCDKWYVAVLIGGNDPRRKEVLRNEEFIKELFAKENAFWTTVEHNIMPEVDGLEDTKNALSIMYPTATPKSELELESTDELEELFRDYAEYKKTIKSLETLKTECENKIKARMGDNERCKIGEHKASWLNMPGRVTVDLKAFAEEMPEAYEAYKKYTKVGNPFRKFTMK